MLIAPTEDRNAALPAMLEFSRDLCQELNLSFNQQPMQDNAANYMMLFTLSALWPATDVTSDMWFQHLRTLLGSMEEEALRRTLKLFPQAISALVSYGQLIEENGHISKADALFRKAWELRTLHMTHNRVCLALKEEPRFLVLGGTASGKKTLLKQLKHLGEDGRRLASLSDDHRPIIIRNVISSAKAVVSQMRRLGLRCLREVNEVSHNIFS
jgi:acyl transferase domain-containing protein